MSATLIFSYNTFYPILHKSYPLPISYGGPACLSGKYLTCNPRVMGSSHTGSSGFFMGVSLGKDTSEPQSSTGETQERHE